MKKINKLITAALFTAAFPLLSGAQTQIPNADFEDWATTADNVDSLVGWSSSSAVVIRPVIALYRDSDEYHGNLAARVVTAPFGIVQYSTIGILVNGSANFSYGGGGGGDNVAYESGGGTPISVKPTALTCYLKYTTLTATDQGLIKVLLTKYNTALQQRDTVSYATRTIARAGYSPITIPLPDMMPGVMPDTITTIFYASDPDNVPPRGAFSDLTIDSLTLFTPEAPTSVHTPGQQSSIEVFPNPGNGLFMLKKNDDGNDNVLVTDITGKNLLRMPLPGRGTYTVDLRTCAAGMYYLKTANRNAPVHKLIISK